MAILTTQELGELRRRSESSRQPISHVKGHVNAAFQAIEDWFGANQASLGVAMEAAAPGVFTAAQKRALVQHWLQRKFERGG